MPFLNLERFLDESIRSVVNQTDPRWELLLVNDGSTDGSGAIASDWAAREPERIRVLAHQQKGSRGASAARNLGIAAAHGRYIAFLDGDDIWLPTKLAEQVPLFEAQPEAGMIYGRTLYWYGWTGKPEDAGRDHEPHLGVPADTLLEGQRLLELCLQGLAAVPCPCSVLVRTELVRSVAGFEESFRYIYTDQTFFAKILLGSSAYVAGKRWDKYRQHAESSTAVAQERGELRPARLAYFRWLETYLREKSSDETEVWRVLHREWRWMEASPMAQRVRRFVLKRRRQIRRFARST
jgi:glycosyltransferase involved in cell wall biosynthesis